MFWYSGYDLRGKNITKKYDIKVEVLNKDMNIYIVLMKKNKK